jgi:hypothetical protein
MAKNKVVDRSNPKSLTTEQRLYLDQLVTKFGPDVHMVKRADLKKATQEILKIKAAPDWITRNLKCRLPHARGRYDLNVLLKLPVVAFAEVEEKDKNMKETKKTKTPKKKTTKKTKEPKKTKTPKVSIEEILNTPVTVPEVPKVLDGIPLKPPVVKKARKAKVVVPPVEPVV